MDTILYNGQTLKDLLKSAELSLQKQIEELNSLNVFPVPDGDTGINMFLTMQSANGSVEQLRIDSIAEMSTKIARGALLGARGNSGVILSQILRGMAKAMETQEKFSAADFARALQQGSDTAYKAIAQPVEGTILTVIREASHIAVKQATSGASLKQIAAAAASQARKTVKMTPELLPALKDAGVVDAGGKGLFYIFQGIKESISKNPAPFEQSKSVPRTTVEKFNGGAYGFDLQFLVEGIYLPVEDMRTTVEKMGESVLVVGDENLVRVHIHTHQPQAVMDYCSSKGKLKDVISENMDKQVENFRNKRSVRPGHKS